MRFSEVVESRRELFLDSGADVCLEVEDDGCYPNARELTGA